MSQPVRADSRIDEHGEALAGHAVCDLYKEEARVHASILAFVHAELPDHLVPCVIGKTLFQDREGQKGRWPGIVPPALQGLAMIASCWEGELHRSLPWVKKSWSAAAGSDQTTPHL